MSDGQIALLILFVTFVSIAAVFLVAAVKHPKEMGEAMVKGIDAAKENWAAQQEAKRKKREETGNAIASILVNIMKKRS